MQKIESKARVAKGKLTTIADIVADKLDDGDIDIFEAYSGGMFPKTFPQSLRDQAVKVNGLSSGKTRLTKRTDAVADLKAQLPDILAGAMRLADYIGAAFPADQHARRLEQCGYTTYYQSATGKNWESVQKMGVDMKSFMESQLETLTTGNIMPAGFPADLNKLFEKFNTEYEKLKTAKTNITPNTNAYTEEVNTLETMLSKVFKSAQAIFRNDPIKRSYYTMNSFAHALRPGTTGAIRSHLFDAVTQLPIIGARVSMPYHNFETTSNKKGAFIIQELKEGRYSLKIEAKGYQTLELTDINVKTGVKTTLKPIAMTAVSADIEIPEVSPGSKTVNRQTAIEPSNPPAIEPSAVAEMSSPELVPVEALASVDLGQKVETNEVAVSENGVH